MARLYDRILSNLQPCRISWIYGRDAFDSSLYSKLDKIGSEERLSPKVIEGVPVIAADDVALYESTFPLGTNMADVVASMAPPFEKFFVEFQKVPNKGNFYAWGSFVTATEDPKETLKAEDLKEKPRWELRLDTFLEREKGNPFGPVSHSYVGLAEDGTWFRHANGEIWWAGDLVKFNDHPPEEVVQNINNDIAQLLFPVLLTISFLHCKNVSLNSVTPDKKLSKKYRKKSGRDLIRYHILDIRPLRKMFEKYKSGEKHDLRRAFHICRGHFKTFTEDAPLFGRYAGTYWWPHHTRGSKKSGIVLKDYRVNAPSEFGKVYREADENPPDSDKEAAPSKDPDSSGRGLSAHNKTQNRIASILSELGLLPMSPKSGEPEYDLAWKANDSLFVCEVKSITINNQERQLRMAIGQVIRYRQKMNAAGYEPVTAVVATEKEIRDQSWIQLFEEENIILLWPEIAKSKLHDLARPVANKD